MTRQQTSYACTQISVKQGNKLYTLALKYLNDKATNFIRLHSNIWMTRQQISYAWTKETINPLIVNGFHTHFYNFRTQYFIVNSVDALNGDLLVRGSGHSWWTRAHVSPAACVSWCTARERWWWPAVSECAHPAGAPAEGPAWTGKAATHIYIVTLPLVYWQNVWMTFNAPPYAGKHVMSTLRVYVTSNTRKILVFWLVQMTLCIMTLHNFPPLVGLIFWGIVWVWKTKEGNCPGLKKTGGELSRVEKDRRETVQGWKRQEGNCPGLKKTGGELSRVEKDRRGTVQGGKRQEGNCPGLERQEGNCPGWKKTGGELFRSGKDRRETVWGGKKTGGELFRSGKDRRGTVRGGKRQEGNWPGWKKTGGELFRSQLIDVQVI